MTDPRLRKEVMSLVTDDFAPLWELGSLAERYADAGRPPEQQLVALIGELVSKELVKLYRGTTFTGEELEVSPERTTEELADPSNWRWDRPRGVEYLQVHATGKGRVAYLTNSF